MLFLPNASVISINVTHVACPSLRYHHSAAVPAKEFRCQKIIVIGGVSRRGFGVLLQFKLYGVENIVLNDLRYAVFDYNVGVLIFSDISAVGKNVSDRIIKNRLSVRSGYILCLKILVNIFHGLAVVCQFEDLFYDLCGNGFYL